MVSAADIGPSALCIIDGTLTSSNMIPNAMARRLCLRMSNTANIANADKVASAMTNNNPYHGISVRFPLNHASIKTKNDTTIDP